VVDGDSWVVAGPQIIEVDDVTAVRVALVGGRVDVVGRDEPGARIEVHRVDGRPLEVSLVDGELRVGYTFTLSGWDNFIEKVRNLPSRDRADVHIAVHRDVAARLGTVEAEGLLADVVGDTQVATVSGNLVTDGTHGAMRVNTVSGDVVVRNRAGDLKANAVSGSVTASGAFAQVSVTTVSGAVAVDASRVAGVHVQTVSGDTTVRIPVGVGLSVSARSVSGRVVVDGQTRGGDGPLTGSVDVTSGDGTCRLKVNSVSGHLTVLRSPAAAGSA
jgi:hypothetical protein